MPSWTLIEESGKYELVVDIMQSNLPLLPNQLQVYVGKKEQPPGSGMPSVLGQVKLEESGLSFSPSIPFRAGVHYTAFLGGEHRFSFEIPTSGAVPNLIAIYPSATNLPANLLKIYLHFSEPMSEGRAYEQLTLTNTVGDTIQQPFVPLQPELWSEDRKRLTLWLDPGRVKRGLLSHETHGVVLEEGEQYRLSISSKWKDIHGNTLGKLYEKKFKVTPPDYQQPLTDNWIIQAPGAGSDEALVIDFGESLDQALANRLIQVHTSIDHPPLEGKIELKGQESQWCFYPDSSWERGTYILVIGSSLEDLAGNNLNRPFDWDLKISHDDEADTRAFFTINFRIK